MRATLTGKDGATSLDEASRRARRARAFMRVAAALLFVSLLAVLACTRVEWSRIVPWLMWNHVAIIVVCAGATFGLRRLGALRPARVAPRLGELFAPPVLALALVAAAIAIPPWAPTPSTVEQAPDGHVASRHQWHASADGARFFERFDRGDEREITQARFDELNRGVYAMFARLWVLFSFVALVMWRFVALRWQAEADGAAPVLRPAAPVAGTPGQGSTVLIGAIWTLAVGANLVVPALAPPAEICTMPLPPLPGRLVLWAAPLVMFTGAAPFMKRSPFLSPWMEGLVDEKLGAGASAAFLARLRPLLLFSVAGLLGAAGLARHCWAADSWAGLTAPGFLASGSVAFAVMHLILRWRRVPGA